MNANEYQTQALRTECDQDRARSMIAASDNRLTRLLHSVVGALGELGELAGLIETRIWYGGNIDPDKLCDEFGDALWYLSQGITAAGLTLEQVMEANLRKLKARYPERYTDSLADRNNRNKSAEAAAVAERGKYHAGLEGVE